MTVEADRLSLDVDVGGVNSAVVVDNFLFSSLNCSCCFREMKQKQVRQNFIQKLVFQRSFVTGREFCITVPSYRRIYM